MEEKQISPVFVGGAGRSGTTLLRVMLHAHPELCAGPEFKLLPAFAGVYQQLLAQKDILQAYELHENHVNEAFARLILDLFRPFQQKWKARTIVEKTPHNVLIMKELGRIFPSSRFIHVVRDGRDVARSLVKMDWRGADGKKLPYVENLENAARYWVQVVSRALEDARQLTGRVLLVHYEDLIHQPEKTMRTVLRFIDVPWDDVVLRHHEAERGYEPEESSTKQVSRARYQNAIGRWKEAFNLEEARKVAEIVNPLLFYFGYEEDPAWAEKVLQR